MNYHAFLNHVIEEGIASARADYSKESQKDKLEGSLDGFEACRNTDPEDLIELHASAKKYLTNAIATRHENYKYFRCYYAEVEFVLNLVSAMCLLEGKPILDYPNYLPTARGVNVAADILTGNKK